MSQRDGPQASGARPTPGLRVLSDITVFERFAELTLAQNHRPKGISDCTYMVTSNLGEPDFYLAEAEYWGSFTDITRRTATGQLEFVSFEEFLNRVLFELRLQTHRGRPLDHTFTVLVKKGFAGEWEILQKTDNSLHRAIGDHYAAWTKHPESHGCMWFNFVFAFRPPRFHPPGPSRQMVDQLLGLPQRDDTERGPTPPPHAPGTTERAPTPPPHAPGTIPRHCETERAPPPPPHASGTIPRIQRRPPPPPHAPGTISLHRRRYDETKRGPPPPTHARRTIPRKPLPQPPSGVLQPPQISRTIPRKPLPQLPSGVLQPPQISSNSNVGWQDDRFLNPRTLLPILPHAPATTSKKSISARRLFSALPKLQSKLRVIKDKMSPLSPRSPISPVTRTRGPDAPIPEEPTTLTALGSEIKHGGIHNLNMLMPVTKSPSMDQWKKCCRLMPDLDPEQLALHPRQRSIRINHSMLMITPVQFYSAIQMLQGRGGFLSHDMGLGKTHTVLAAAALKALIIASKKRCETDWASPFASRHLVKNVAARGLTCPTQRPQDVACYCVPDSMTRIIYDELTQSPGATLIHIPSTARATWLEAIVNAKFRLHFNFRFVSKSADVPAELRINLETTKKTLFRMGAIEKTQTIRNTLDLDWTSRTGLDGLGSYVFIVLHNDSDWYNTFQYKPSELRPRPQPDCVFPGTNGTCYAAPIGLTFIDEAHLPGLWRPTSAPMIMARCHNHILGGRTWFVTGTPFGQEGPKSLEPAVRLIDPDLADRQMPHLLELYEDAVHKRTTRYINDFTAEFQRVFSHKIVLRFLHQTLFLDRPISSIQVVQPTVISSRLSKLGFTRSHVQQLITKRQARLPTHLPYADALDVSEATRDVRDELHFLSLFPAAAKLIETGKITVHDRGMRQAIRALGDQRGDVGSIPEVAQHWQAAVRDSPKARVLLDYLDRMDRDPRARRLPPGAYPRAGERHHYAPPDPAWKKMVVVTPTVATAVYLYLYLSRTPGLRDRAHAGLYHADLSQRAKAQLQADFASLARTRSCAAAHPLVRTLVGPFAAVGTGINLQAASYQVLTSPPSARADDLAQAFARTNRGGQTLPVDHALLVLEDSPVDRIHMAGLARRELASDPYDVAAPVELRPLKADEREDAAAGPASGPVEHPDLYKMNRQLTQTESERS